ncbi:MAG: M16 family metallopeptidase [Fimbriimonadales bacterium]
MRTRVTYCALALAALAGLARGQDVKCEKYTLSNGMTVILHEDHALPVATVNIWYHVGSKDEPPHRSGFAHLFEHLMFMGTRRAPKGDFDNIMEAGGGNNNASTTQDRTNFFDYGPSSLLPTLLWLEADRLEDLGRMMDQKKLDLQREVVKNERRQTVENAPYGMASLKIDEAMYPEGHPYHIDTIGLPEDIDAATVRDVKSFFATYYVPNNATMVVAGDFDPSAIKPVIRRLFGTLPRGNDPIHRTEPSPVLHEVRRLTIVDKVAQARSYMVWHSPAAFKQGDAELELLAGLLSDGFASRLYQRLVVKDRIASDVSAEQGSQYLGSLFMIVATAKEGVSPDKLEAAIDDEIAKLLATGPDSEELAREKAKYQLATFSSLESLSDVADRLNEFDFYLGEPNSFKWDLDRHTKLGSADLLTWARRILDPNARLILRVVPESDEPDQNPRDQRPKIGAAKDLALPVPTQFKLSNGLNVFYFSRPELPLMSVSMQFDGGYTSDPAAKSGLASMTSGMLGQGAGALDAAAFSKEIDAIGASFSAGSSETASEVNLLSTEAGFEKGLSLFADAIIRPRLDAVDLDRQRALRLDELAQEADDPENVARLVALREFFGSSHPYGKDPAGKPASIKAITIEDVKQEHDGLFRPDKATLFAAGSLPLDRVKTDLERQFGEWKATAGTKPLPAIRYPAPASKGLRVVIVDKPAAVQTVIRFIFPGVPYGNPNRIALEGLGAVLGGTFTSRLNANLREAKGYTYGAGARYEFERALGYMNAGASVRSNATGASLREFLFEFARLRTGDVKDSEVIKARASMRTESIAAMSSLGGLIGTAEELFLNNRSMGDLTRELKSISGLTAAAINPLARQAVPPDRGVLVLVGDKNLILKQLAGLKLPKPEIVPGLQ